MTLARNAVLTTAIVFLCGIEWAYSLRAEFYLNENYKGFLEESIISGAEELKCIPLKSGQKLIKSIKTDKCLILYESNDCKWPERRKRDLLSYVLRLDESVAYMSSLKGSFHVCSQELGGGPQLDLDIYAKSKESQPESYRGVCGCRKVPARYVGGKSFPVFFNNHGNSVNLYGDENCGGKPYLLYAGINHDELYRGDIYPFDVRSFRPAELTSCFRLAAKIHKFHFANNTESIDGLPMDKVKLASDSLIKNNGSTEVTQTFKVSSTVTESVEFSVAKSFTETETTGVEAGVTITTEVGVPLITSVEIQASISGKYEWSKENSGETSNTTTVTTEETVEVEQQIKVPPCKICTVATYVKKVKDFSIKYKAYAKVSAAEGAPSISAKELRDSLPAGLDYVKDINENTVEAVTDGTMSADFGLKALIEVDCEPIVGCDASQFGPGDDHQVYESPLHFIRG